MDNTPASVTGWTPVHQQRNGMKRNVTRQLKSDIQPTRTLHVPYINVTDRPMTLHLVRGIGGR